MPHGLQPQWRDQIRRLPALAVAALLAIAAGPGPPPLGTQAKPGATQAGQTRADQVGQTRPDEAARTDGATPAATASSGPDRMVASVDGHPIYLSDLGQAQQALPASLRNMSFQALYPILLDRMVDHQALVRLARQRGLQDDPAVKKQIEQATERVLEAALLDLDGAPKVTDDVIKARYAQVYANHPATEQVHARHILVRTEAEANQIIADLKNGAEFAALARQDSKDPDSQNGGDLGFISRDQVSPAFADAAFALQPGQVADHPVHNEFGWHVVQVEERRTLAPPSYADAHDALRDQLMQEAVHQEVALARSQLIIHELNLDGSSRDPDARPVGVAAPPK